MRTIIGLTVFILAFCAGAADFPLHDTDGDGIPDVEDRCILFPNCSEALDYNDARGFTFADEYVITNLWENIGFEDSDNDGTHDYIDPCIFVPGTDPLLCTYDINDDGRVTNKDWKACKALQCDLTGDGLHNRDDRTAWREAKAEKRLRGPGCIHQPDDESGELDGVSTCY